LYVGSQATNRLVRVAPNLTITEVAPVTTPCGCVVDGNGNVLIGDRNGLLRVTPGGVTERLVDTTAVCGVDIDPEGSIWYARTTGTVFRWGRRRTAAAGGHGRAVPARGRGLARGGHLLLVEHDESGVRARTRAGSSCRSTPPPRA
jgi:hypothetical protein